VSPGRVLYGEVSLRPEQDLAASVRSAVGDPWLMCARSVVQPWLARLTQAAGRRMPDLEKLKRRAKIRSLTVFSSLRTTWWSAAWTCFAFAGEVPGGLKFGATASLGTLGSIRPEPEVKVRRPQPAPPVSACNACPS
jgi:hypothetical protein